MEFPPRQQAVFDELDRLMDRIQAKSKPIEETKPSDGGLERIVKTLQIEMKMVQNDLEALKNPNPDLQNLTPSESSRIHELQKALDDKNDELHRREYEHQEAIQKMSGEMEHIYESRIRDAGIQMTLDSGIGRPSESQMTLSLRIQLHAVTEDRDRLQRLLDAKNSEFEAIQKTNSGIQMTSEVQMTSYSGNQKTSDSQMTSDSQLTSESEKLRIMEREHEETIQMMSEQLDTVYQERDRLQNLLDSQMTSETDMDLILENSNLEKELQKAREELQSRNLEFQKILEERDLKFQNLEGLINQNLENSENEGKALKAAIKELEDRLKLKTQEAVTSESLMTLDVQRLQDQFKMIDYLPHPLPESYPESAKEEIRSLLKAQKKFEKFQEIQKTQFDVEIQNLKKLLEEEKAQRPLKLVVLQNENSNLRTLLSTYQKPSAEIQRLQGLLDRELDYSVKMQINFEAQIRQLQNQNARRLQSEQNQKTLKED